MITGTKGGSLSRAEAECQARDRFLAILSHELRAPLTPVMLTLDQWQTDPLLPATWRPLLEMMRHNLQVEARLLEDLLDLTRIIQGKLPLFPKETDIHQALQHCLRTSAPDIRAKSLRVEAQLAAKRSVVHGDPVRLEQIFSNLIRNAVKFSDANGPVFIASADEGEQQVRVEVRDQGCGIDPEILPQLFHPFKQELNSSTGLGLGLSICKALVEAHQGTITAASGGRGRGACFTVRLPACRSAAAAPSGSPLPPQAAKKKRILLVEDHADTARAMARLLQIAGHEVVWTETVRAALAAAAGERFDLLISDLGLPDGSGCDLLRQMGKTRPPAAIAVSGYGMEEDRRSSREAGFDAHLVKPVEAGKLEELIRRLEA